MKYNEMYVELEKEIINPIREEKELNKYNALRNTKMLLVSEVFPSLQLHESINNVVLKWDDEITDNLELACKNDLIMFVGDL